MPNHARVELVLPDGPSDPRADFLRMPEAAVRMSERYLRAEDDDTQEYAPSPQSELIATIDLAAGRRITPEDVQHMVHRRLSEAKLRYTSYGRRMDSGLWAYTNYLGDERNVYDRLALGEQFYFQGADIEANLARLADFRRRVERLVEDEPALSAAAFSLEEGGVAERVKLIASLRESTNLDVQLFLTPPEGTIYKGKDIFDVFEGIAVPWGDMDIFHWGFELLGDSLFSVESLSGSGYFFPEEAAAGRLFSEGLVLYFNLARSPAPLEVYMEMVKAARYARDRLGGTLVDDRSAPLDASDQADRMRASIDRLTAAGFPPGAGATVRLF